LTRALHEYFVGGIKTNISLFRRILTDADFQAGTVDTGYLDRLLKSKASEVMGEDAEVAAIAAGIFEILDLASVVGNGTLSPNTGNQTVGGITLSGWKKAARFEGLA
jgi:acetyl-CoA carboxylase biotin carboxylase subunit